MPEKTQSKKPHTSKSSKAGLQFPVGRMHRHMRSDRRARIGSESAVYLAAACEYIVAEVLELGGNAAKDFKQKRITPRHLQLAVRNDGELNKLLEMMTIASGGVLPNIHEQLLKKKSQPAEKPESQAATP